MRSLLPAPAWVHEFVRASFRAAEDVPEAREQLSTLEDDGKTACPRCGVPLDLGGYRRTETSFVVEEVLACSGCSAQLLLAREERA